ncbi:hypothetical protein ACQPW3_25935 [Actinosynnema sp. CA-248983]
MDLLHDGSAKFDLGLVITETDDRLVVEVEYDTGLYRAATARLLVHRYLTVLAALARDPGLRLSRLPIPDEAVPPAPGHPPAARAAVDEWWARGGFPPSRAAVVDGSGVADRGWVARAAHTVTRLLRERGVGRGDVVAVSAGQDRWAAAAVAGVLGAGAALLPLPPAPSGDTLERVPRAGRPALLLRMPGGPRRRSTSTCRSTTCSASWPRAAPPSCPSPRPTRTRTSGWRWRASGL